MVDCLTSQQHAHASQRQIHPESCMCCHTEVEVSDPTCRLTQSQYNGTRPASPSADPVTPSVRQGSHWSAHAYITGTTRGKTNILNTGRAWIERGSVTPAFAARPPLSLAVWSSRCQGTCSVVLSVSGHLQCGPLGVRAPAVWSSRCQGTCSVVHSVSGHLQCGPLGVRAPAVWSTRCQGTCSVVSGHL